MGAALWNSLASQCLCSSFDLAAGEAVDMAVEGRTELGPAFGETHAYGQRTRTQFYTGTSIATKGYTPLPSHSEFQYPERSLNGTGLVELLARDPLLFCRHSVEI